MELARKETNNQETQQAKRLGSQNVRGVSVKIKKEAQFEGQEKSYDEKGAEEFGDRGGMVVVGGARARGGDHQSFGGEHKEVTSDVLPGVSTVSLSLSQKKA